MNTDIENSVSSIKLIGSRTVSLKARKAKEVLLRDDNGFMLYLADDASVPGRYDRIIQLEAREALLWLHEEMAT
jgi:hypothetical protein